jgi:hypothetical protein
MRWFRRRRPAHPPREGWIVLIDQEGREVSARIPVVVNCDPHLFKVDHSLTWRELQTTTVAGVRVIDADGNTHDAPIDGDEGVDDL